MTTFHEHMHAGSGVALANPDVKAGSFSLELIDTMYATMMKDRAGEFQQCYDYLHGDHLKPFAPTEATAQIEDLRERSIANWIPLLVNLPSQISFVDGYRRSVQTDDAVEDEAPETRKALERRRYTPEWDVWQRSRGDAKQAVVYRAALTYGQGFTVVDNLDPANVRNDILPTRNTVAFFRDPVNDIRPAYVLTIKTFPRDDKTHGLAVFWDDVHRWELALRQDGTFVAKGAPFVHGLDGCPVIRYTCFIDDEGATMGVVKPAIPLQDRINQSTFDTNITASFGSFKVRTAAGLQPSYREDPENPGSPLLINGQPVPEPLVVSQARMLVSTSETTKFDTLDETPLAGFLQAEEAAARNFTTISQFPPLASISNLANLSAEAWAAAEAQFIRWVTALQVSWGESHEELLRLNARAVGDIEGATNYGGEVRWRDMTTKSFAIVMDGLSKAVSLGVPGRGLWPMIPGTTSGQLQDWDDLAEVAVQDAMSTDFGMAQANAAARQKTGAPAPTIDTTGGAFGG